MTDQNQGFATIDEYIGTFAPEIQNLLQSIRKVISEAAPGATEKISYQMPTFFLKGNLVHFAAFKNHIGFYPTPTGVASFQEDFKNYKTSKGGIQFPLDKPIPLDLIRRIVEFRVRENSLKKMK